MSVSQDDHLPPSSTEVKNEWSMYLHTPYISSWCGHGQFCLYLLRLLLKLNDFYKISAYKCHTAHQLGTISYGIKKSVLNLGSSEFNSLTFGAGIIFF